MVRSKSKSQFVYDTASMREITCRRTSSHYSSCSPLTIRLQQKCKAYQFDITVAIFYAHLSVEYGRKFSTTKNLLYIINMYLFCNNLIHC